MKRVASDWAEVVLVCRKCARKMKGGFGPDGDDDLVKALRKEAAKVGGPSDGRKGRKSGKPKRRGTRIAVLAVDCFDICPKNAAIVVNARAPDLWQVVPPGVETSQVLARLGLDGSDAAGA